MPRLTRIPEAEVDSQPVIVPRNDKAIVTTSPVRVARLVEHLSAILSATKPTSETEHPNPSEPQGFAARVAGVACSLCRGWCCRNGSDDAFLDERTLARLCRARPDLTAEAIVPLYRERVPQTGHAGSCIFHGTNGCTLDRLMRSDVCNSYFCGGLHGYLATGDAGTPVVVIAGEGRTMRTSPLLIPTDRDRNSDT